MTDSSSSSPEKPVIPTRKPDIQFVYRALRQISVWAIGAFYSEIDVEGGEEMPRAGPVLVACTHHNEILDSGTLSMTLPHRRHIHYWTKASLFVNRLSRAIFSSSGAIPVKRGARASDNNDHSVKGNSLSTDRQSLFNSTIRALGPPLDPALHPTNEHTPVDTGGVVAIFPEGTSYTRSRIVQLLPGIAWAAIGYVRAVRAGEFGVATDKTGLLILPTAIIYTDKSQYRSRISVKYGKLIDVDSYVAGGFNDEGSGSDTKPHFDKEHDHDSTRTVDNKSREAVKSIMRAVESQLLELAVNARDWNTLCAARAACAIEYGQRKVPTREWRDVIQRYIDVITPLPIPEDGSSVLTANTARESAKVALARYFALQQYTGIWHHDLVRITEPTNFAALAQIPFHAIRALISFALFAPILPVAIPGYVTGLFAARILAVQGEEEAQAQFKAVFGCIGSGLALGAIGLSGVAHRLWRILVRNLAYLLLKIRDRPIGGDIANFLGQTGFDVEKLVELLTSASRTFGQKWIGPTVGICVLWYCIAHVLVWWHNSLVDANLQRLHIILATWRLIIGLAFTRKQELTAEEMNTCSVPVQPAANLYLARLEGTQRNVEGGHPRRKVASRKVVRELLRSRVVAEEALKHLRDMNEK